MLPIFNSQCTSYTTNDIISLSFITAVPVAGAGIGVLLVIIIVIIIICFLRYGNL